MVTIGVLALQGDFEKHIKMIQQTGESALSVKTKTELDLCDGLIIPGGESTTLVKLMKKHGMWDEVKAFGQSKPVFGTCAGLIVVSKKLVNYDMETLGFIDIETARNAYGRQIDSFIDDIEIELDKIENVEGVFIRAPQIVNIGANVKKLGVHKNQIVLAEQGHVMVATFHPELTDDIRIHSYFVNKVKTYKATSVSA